MFFWQLTHWKLACALPPTKLMVVRFVLLSRWSFKEVPHKFILVLHVEENQVEKRWWIRQTSIWCKHVSLLPVHKTNIKPSFYEFPLQKSSFRVCLRLCRDWCALPLTMFESISTHIMKIKCQKNNLSNALSLPMGGLANDRTIISLWALWKYNTLELANQKMYFISYKHKPYSNVKETVGKETFCHLYASKHSVVLGKGCRKFS